MRKQQTPYQFFKANAGYSYDPKTQTPEEGQRCCAEALADAEAFARTAGLSFEWREDDQTDESFRNTDDPYNLWVCVCHDEEGGHLTSCGGIDLGRDGKPWADKYRRVMEAELALEAMTNIGK